MAKENRGRNDIVRALNQEGIKISAGSVSNIIAESRKSKTLALKSNTSTQEENQDRRQHSDTERVTTFPEEGLAETEFKKKDISIENHTITNTQDFEENGYPVEGRNGGPLSWFTNGSSSLTHGVELASAQVNIPSNTKENQYVKNEKTEEEFEDSTQYKLSTSTSQNQGPSVITDTRPLVDWDS